MMYLWKSLAVEEGTAFNQLQGTVTKRVHTIKSNAHLLTAIFYCQENGKYYIDESLVWEN